MLKTDVNRHVGIGGQLFAALRVQPLVGKMKTPGIFPSSGISARTRFRPSAVAAMAKTAERRRPAANDARFFALSGERKPLALTPEAFDKNDDPPEAGAPGLRRDTVIFGIHGPNPAHRACADAVGQQDEIRDENEDEDTGRATGNELQR